MAEAGSTPLPFAAAKARVVQQLGGGATSSVWLVAEGGRNVALKVGRDLGQRLRLADEARHLLFAGSSRIPALLGAGLLPAALAPEGSVLRPGLPYLALERVPGVALDSFISGLRPGLTPVVPAKRVELTLELAIELGSALDELHSTGAAHGDVKPANMLVEWEGSALTSLFLIDLGLAGPKHETEPHGGTRRYFAPEVLSGELSTAESRDLWAFGRTLLEFLSPNLAPDVARSWPTDWPPDLTRILGALLSRDPRARPSARWVVARAQAALGTRETRRAAEDRRRRAVRRAYLSVRRREIELRAREPASSVELVGVAAEWVEPVLAIQRQIETLSGRLPEPRPEESAEVALAPLSPLGKARWLACLVGPSAAPWVAARFGPDHELADELLLLCARLEPVAWSLGDLKRPPATGDRSPAEPPAENGSDPVELALALGRGVPTEGLLEAAEALFFRGRASPAFGLELGRQLRRRGHHGRALAVLTQCPALDACVEIAEVLRRTGDLEGARRLLEGAEPAPSERDEARRLATLARVELQIGSSKRALELLLTAPESAETLEVRGLAELAAGRPEEAEHALERGRMLATSDEDRARIAGAAGFVAHHASGDDERALASFRLAAAHAARAGAVVEEATYLTSVAAVAPHVGEFAEALAAAARSELLFECAGKVEEAARAALARAAAHAALGNVEEARDAADEAMRRARVLRDRRCEAYAHLALSDVLPAADVRALDHAERARLLLPEAESDDRVRVATRLLRAGAKLDVVELDRLAAKAPVDVRLEWWGERAAGEAKSPAASRARTILGELCQLAQERSPVAVRGAALAAGAELAARVADGESARRLAVAVGEAARELVRRATTELKPLVLGLDWVKRFQAPRDGELEPGQIAEIEALLRALGRRDRLKPLLDAVVDALVLWTGVERGLLLLRAPGERLRPRAARNLTREDLKGLQLELSHSLAQRALERREPVVAVDAAGDLPEIHASVHALKLRSVLAVPLIAYGDVLGVVYLDDRVRRGAFGDRELSWVRLVAAIAAVAIADARDQLLLRRALRRAERAEARVTNELAEREARLDVAERALARAREGRETRFAYDSIVGESPAIRDMLVLVDRVAVSEVPVLIVGESGSGKELVARAIHDNGRRGSEPFVSENCAAIPEGLLEATLFGHTRGAFTGAVRPRAGLFEVADGGTLFLDEVGEMSLAMQSKLLRALQDGEIRPVGAARGRRVDVRVMGATHRDLATLVLEGKFREDLMYRLNVITVRVPALRERSQDIPALALHFLKAYGGTNPPRLSKAALKALASYRWPGNVRQLENEIRRAIVLADDLIEVEHLSETVLDRAAPEATADGLNVRHRVDALEFEMVTTALSRTDGNQTRAAELLGLSRFGLQKMMRRLGIQVEQHGGPAPRSS